MFQRIRSLVSLSLATTAVAAGLVCLSVTAARGQENLVAKVDPCVVTIRLDNGSEGSGFVVDSKGVIVTNYHVIEGAKKATVYFPDKKSLPVTGFLAFSTAKDIAVLQIEPGDRVLPALSFAANLPDKGEPVFAFGSPVGFSGTVTNGIVSALRQGSEVREALMNNPGHVDIYKDKLGYDLEAQWIQTTAPISPGNSGGPLVNARGEVVGMNTWCAAGSVGQNLNFSLSAVHVKKLVSTSGKIVEPLASLPAPRVTRSDPGKGGAAETMALWKRLNALRSEYAKEIEEGEKRLQRIVPGDPRNIRTGANTRYKRKGTIYEQLAKACSAYAKKVKTLDTARADGDVVVLSVLEADLAQRMCDAYQQLVVDMAALADDTARQDEWRLRTLQQGAANLRTKRDVVRVNLNRKYNENFPSEDEGGAGALADSANADAKETADSPPKGERAAQTSGTRMPEPTADRSVMRVWTDRSGRHQTQAKFLGLEEGKVRLERADGKTILIAISSLSEADQRFLGVIP